MHLLSDEPPSELTMSIPNPNGSIKSYQATYMR